LEADDLLVFEDDASQQIRSLRRVPSSVLLLLDASGELNPAMNTNTTREIAINRRKDYQEATNKSERRLGDLADETGGLMLLPGSSAEMLRQGEMIAREIDTQYVVAYAPKNSLATAADGEYRRIKVATRRGGQEVRTRRGYVPTSR
jgi:hypothetical protein